MLHDDLVGAALQRDALFHNLAATRVLHHEVVPVVAKSAATVALDQRIGVGEGGVFDDFLISALLHRDSGGEKIPYSASQTRHLYRVVLECLRNISGPL